MTGASRASETRAIASWSEASQGCSQHSTLRSSRAQAFASARASATVCPALASTRRLAPGAARPTASRARTSASRSLPTLTLSAGSRVRAQAPASSPMRSGSAIATVTSVTMASTVGSPRARSDRRGTPAIRAIASPTAVSTPARATTPRRSRSKLLDPVVDASSARTSSWSSRVTGGRHAASPMPVATAPRQRTRTSTSTERVASTRPEAMTKGSSSGTESGRATTASIRTS